MRSPDRPTARSRTPTHEPAATLPELLAAAATVLEAVEDDLPGFNEATARQVRERVERLGPFQSLDEVILEVDVSPAFERHLREYAVLIP